MSKSPKNSTLAKLGNALKSLPPEKAGDIVVGATLEVTVGRVPVIGGTLKSLVKDVIGPARIRRVGKWCLVLAEKVTPVQFEKASQTEEGVDLIEEGIVQASRSLSQERLNHIAELVARGLKAEDTEQQQARHFLRILSLLDDRQIILLAKYLPENSPTSGNEVGVEFHKTHLKVLNPGEVVEDMFDNTGKEKASTGLQLNTSMIIHLASFGLIDADAAATNMGLPMGEKKFLISPLGHSFLEFIGLTNKR